MAPILSRTGQRNESVVSRLEHLVDVMSVQLGQRSTEANIFGAQTEPIPVAEQNPDTNTTLIPYSNQRTSRTEGETLTKPFEHQRQTVNIFRQRWRYKMRIGSVAIEVQTTSRRREGSPKGDTSFAICIHFLPDQSVFSFPGLSISWATGPDKGGFYQLAPMISMYPILAPDHPVWNAISRGDLKCVQDMLTNGDVSLRSKDVNGYNLLHVSVLLIWKKIFMVSQSFLLRRIESFVVGDSLVSKLHKIKAMTKYMKIFAQYTNQKRFYSCWKVCNVFILLTNVS
jgi:hypothetical protein